MSIDLAAQVEATHDLVAQILDEARSQGATAAEVSANQDVGLSVAVRQGEVETVEFNQDRGFGITVFLDGRKGSASTSDASERAIADTVRAALNIARYTQEDEYAGLAAADAMASELVPLDLYHPTEFSADQATELALNCEAAGLAQDQRVEQSDGASASGVRSLRLYGNSNGFIGSHLATRYGASCSMIAGSAGDGMQRDYDYTVARRFEDLRDVTEVGARAAQRAVARMQPRKTQTGRFPVLFSSDTAGGIIGHLLSALNGGALYRKASFLLDSLGEQLLPAGFSIYEEPHLPCSLGAASFDGDGLPTRGKFFVEDGVVASYILSTYSARRLEMQSTGNASGVHNVSISGPCRDVESLRREMGTGLVVTDLMGQGVNGVTGDYSRGASGFWVENGEIAYPVDEITIAANLRDMYRELVAIGDDVDLRGNIRAPSLLIEGMMVAGE